VHHVYVRYVRVASSWLTAGFWCRPIHERPELCAICSHLGGVWCHRQQGQCCMHLTLLLCTGTGHCSLATVKPQGIPGKPQGILKSMHCSTKFTWALIILCVLNYARTMLQLSHCRTDSSAESLITEDHTQQVQSACLMSCRVWLVSLATQCWPTVLLV